MRIVHALSVLVITLVLAACGQPSPGLPFIVKPSQPDSTNVIPTSPTNVTNRRTVTVFAAASLTGAFQEIGKDFETAYPDVEVRFNFAGSQILRMQIEQGATADIFASADHKNMDALVAGKLVLADSYQDFATNKLIVILPKSNPASILALVDMAKPGLKVILADSSVPAGNYARQVLEKMSANKAFGSNFSAMVLSNVVSNETDVKQVVTKVELGEADAGIVYVSDAVSAPDLATLSIPDELNIVARYPIAVLSDAPEPSLAEAFTAYVLSPNGQGVLEKWGFSGVSR